MVTLIWKQVEIDMTGLVQGQTSHHVELRHEPITDRVLHHNSNHGASLPGPRITQLQIPQTEATYFGRDGSSTATPCNFLVSQAGELYNVRHPLRHKPFCFKLKNN